MLKKVREILMLPATLWVVYLLFAVVAGIQAIMIGTHSADGFTYTDYNNYIIFRNSFTHLVQGKNLFTHYPAEYWDLYKYSPAFALFMVPFSVLPDWIGLPIWNMLNAGALLWGCSLLPFDKRAKVLIGWLLLLELLTSMQNAQSNGLMAGLIIGGYGCLRKDKTAIAALCFMLATFVKIYGCFGLLFFLFCPNKVKAGLYTALWGAILALVPLAITNPSTLWWQYQNWQIMLAADKAASYGLSVMGWLHSWFGLSGGKDIITLIGFALLLLPLARIKMYRDQAFQLLFLSSILIWIIIFNYKAESPTFIIAMAGIGIRHFVVRRSLWNNIFLATVFVLTCMSPTDLFPPYLRDHFFIPYTIKAIPCIVGWLLITYELMAYKPKAMDHSTAAIAS